MFSHIHSVTVAVADQDAALDFYVNTLGWEKTMDASVCEDVRWVTVAPPGATTQLALGHASWFREGKAPSKEPGISLVTPDIQTMYDTLTARGVKFKGPIMDMPWGDKGTWFYDLDGNEFFVAGK